MKKYLFILLSLYCASLMGQELINQNLSHPLHPQNIRMKGKALSFKEDRFRMSYKFGELTKDADTLMTKIYYLNIKGQVDVVETFEPNMNCSGGFYHCYDHYYYDSDGRIVKNVCEGRKVEYIYGPNGVSEINTYLLSDGKLESKMKFDYSNGVKSSILYNEYGKVACFIGAVSKLLYLKSGQSYPKAKYKGYYVNTYKNGKLYKESRLVETIIYSYNTQGDLVKISSKYKEKETPMYIYTYTYDEHGNWIHCVEKNLGGYDSKYRIFERTITYASSDEDFNYIDPEKAEQDRKKAIADSIATEKERIKAERLRIEAEKAAIKAKEDSIARIEREKEIEEHKRQKCFEFNVFNPIHIVDGLKLDVDDSGLIEVKLEGIQKSSYRLYKKTSDGTCLLSSEGDNCIVLHYNVYGQVTDALFVANVHSENGAQKYRFCKQAVKKLNKIYHKQP